MNEQECPGGVCPGSHSEISAYYLWSTLAPHYFEDSIPIPPSLFQLPSNTHRLEGTVSHQVNVPPPPTGFAPGQLTTVSPRNGVFVWLINRYAGETCIHMGIANNGFTAFNSISGFFPIHYYSSGALHTITFSELAIPYNPTNHRHAKNGRALSRRL